MSICCSSWTNKLITSKDHAAVQINIGHLNEEGVYTTGQFSTFALTGAVRAQVGMAPPSRGTTVAWWRRMCRGGRRQSVDARGGSTSSWVHVAGYRVLKLLDIVNEFILWWQLSCCGTSSHDCASTKPPSTFCLLATGRGRLCHRPAVAEAAAGRAPIGWPASPCGQAEGGGTAVRGRAAAGSHASS